ncbi:MAG: AAA family ATPase [Myxococcales bacterium]|nr:AAA family ATPase [Myxococcales bacterium]
MDEQSVARCYEVGGVELLLAHPDELVLRWVGQEEALKQVLAAWLVLHETDLPLSPRLVGKSGAGKTSLAYAAGLHRDQEVYLLQATMDMRPEDLLITPVIGKNGQLRYVASPLVTAMIRGGVCILDEGNRMSERAWAALAPLLDQRRYVESMVTGLKIKAHPEFRLAVTMNEDAATFEIPAYIHARLQPQIRLDFPSYEDELAILESWLPFVEMEILEYVVDFLQRAHEEDERFTVRDGINIARYAAKILENEEQPIEEALHLATLQILGEEAHAYIE